MMSYFTNKRIPIRQLRKQYPLMPDNCIRCQLFLHCQSYKILARVIHKGERNGTVLIVGQYPDKKDDNVNRILPDKSLLRFVKEYLDDYTVWMTYAVKCHTNEVKTHEIRQCLPFLRQDIEYIKPARIIAIGNISKQALLETNNREFEECVLSVTTVNDANVHLAFSRTRAYIEGTITRIPFVSPDQFDWNYACALAIDTEWNLKTGELHTVGLANHKQATAMPFDKFRKLLPKLHRYTQTIIGHNLKEDLKILRKHGIQLNAKFYVDTLILARQLIGDDLLQHNLDVYARILHIEDYMRDITSEDYANYSSKLARYCAGDCYTAYRLWQMLSEDMSDYGSEWLDYSKVYRIREDGTFHQEEGEIISALRLDMDMIPVAVDMELAGIKVNLNRYSEHLHVYKQKLNTLRQEIYDTYGINPSSPAQVLSVLQKQYNINDTREETLASLDGELPTKILEFRKLNTFVTRYLESLPDYIDSEQCLHTHYHIARANTGRGATSDPNIQNIPPDLRDIFVSKFGDDGCLVTVDASQSEYRCIAYLSGYKPLIDAYMQGIDIHTWCAEMCGIDRRDAKTLNFARLYGAGTDKLVRLLVQSGKDEKTAKEIVQIYLRETAGLETYQQELIDFANRMGYIVSPLGRRGKRLNTTQIINFPVQSFSADLNKWRLIRLYRLLKQHCKYTHIWLEFHDGIEIDLYLPEKEILLECIGKLPQFIPDILNRGIVLPMPLEVKFHENGWM